MTALNATTLGASITHDNIEAAIAFYEVVGFEVAMRFENEGKPLFPRRILSPGLRLTAVQQMGTSMVELRYEVRAAE